jgi:hypothetical protein
MNTPGSQSQVDIDYSSVKNDPAVTMSDTPRAAISETGT